MSEQRSELKPKSKIRRELLKLGGLIALLPELPLSTVFASPPKDQKFSEDLAILNVALGLEHQAIAAYQAVMEIQLLSKDMLDLVTGFQKDHKSHRDSIKKIIKRYGGTPVEPQQYNFGSINTADDILQLAHRLEQE